MGGLVSGTRTRNIQASMEIRFNRTHLTADLREAFQRLTAPVAVGGCQLCPICARRSCTDTHGPLCCATRDWRVGPPRPGRASKTLARAPQPGHDRAGGDVQRLASGAGPRWGKGWVMGRLIRGRRFRLRGRSRKEWIWVLVQVLVAPAMSLSVIVGLDALFFHDRSGLWWWAFLAVFMGVSIVFFDFWENDDSEP
jgi:hypothetical protein